MGAPMGGHANADAANVGASGNVKVPILDVGMMNVDLANADSSDPVFTVAIPTATPTTLLAAGEDGGGGQAPVVEMSRALTARDNMDIGTNSEARSASIRSELDMKLRRALDLGDVVSKLQAMEEASERATLLAKWTAPELAAVMELANSENRVTEAANMELCRRAEQLKQRIRVQLESTGVSSTGT